MLFAKKKISAVLQGLKKKYKQIKNHGSKIETEEQLPYTVTEVVTSLKAVTPSSDILNDGVTVRGHGQCKAKHVEVRLPMV